MSDIEVSIHVPLAEHDAGCLVNLEVDIVSIHVPLAEHDIKDDCAYIRV